MESGRRILVWRLREQGTLRLYLYVAIKLHSGIVVNRTPKQELISSITLSASSVLEAAKAGSPQTKEIERDSSVRGHRVTPPGE